MELFLNSAWALVAISIACLWVRLEQRDKAERRLPFISMVMLILLLFPVISVSDDLQSLHNPAEADTYLRRDQLSSFQHLYSPATAAPPQPAFAELSVCFQSFVLPINTSPAHVSSPALDAIQNRPPPAL
jgi:hypothetical protein